MPVRCTPDKHGFGDVLSQPCGACCAYGYAFTFGFGLYRGVQKDAYGIVTITTCTISMPYHLTWIRGAVTACSGRDPNGAKANYSVRRKDKFSIYAKAGLLALLFFLPTVRGDAATATTTFAITVSVMATCLISATALNFPAYTGVVSDIATTISLTCTNSTTYNVGLNAGTASGASVVNRMMTSAGGAHLLYSLYSDTGRTVNWGNTVGTDTVARTGNGSAQVLNVYGRLAAEQFVTPGNYTDTIIATVTY